MRSRHGAALAGSVLAVSVLLGAALGSLWFRLAPGVLSLVLGDGSTAPLPTETYHRFDGIALFVLMGLGAGLVSGAALWQWQSQRGVVALLGGVAAAAVSAWVAYRCGLLWTGQVGMGAGIGPAGTLVRLPPVLGSAVVIIAQPLGAALAYGVAVSFSGDEDLGRPAGSVARQCSGELVAGEGHGAQDAQKLGFSGNHGSEHP